MTDLLSARIIEWDPEKGYGYLNASGRRLFLHIKDFAQRYKKPEVGDVIQFSIGEDTKGRRCAVGAVHAYEGGRIRIPNILVLLALMFLPVLASLKLELSSWLIGGYVLVISFITFMIYAHDKVSSREGQSRVSESLLHFFELIGGWPGAYLAQCQLRHKCSKKKYRIIFLLIVLGYQYLATDYLYDWPILSAVFEMFYFAVEGLQG